FDLGDRVEARQIDLLALFLGELRPQNECPVVEALANDLRAQLVCCRLQCGNVINSQERVVILSIMRCTASSKLCGADNYAQSAAGGGGPPRLSRESHSA